MMAQPSPSVGGTAAALPSHLPKSVSSPSRTLGGRSGSGMRATTTGGGSAAVDNASLDDDLSSLLASPRFTVASYLNLALAEEGDDERGGKTDAVSTTAPSSNRDERDEALQRRMAELALQLQIRTQSCHDEIGRIGAELQAVLPRCAADVGRLRAGLAGMEDDARGLLRGVAAAAPSSSGVGVGGGDESASSAAAATTSPLATLSTLHALRSNLATTRAILAAASSWDETIQSVPALLSSQDLAGAVRALTGLEAGARALRGMPDGREERAEALARLRGRTEVLLKPQLLHALGKMDTRLGPLRQCVDMYRSLGKADALREEYVKTRPGGVHDLWFAFAGGGGAGVAKGGAKSKAREDVEGEMEENAGGEKGAEDPADGFYDADTDRLPPVDVESKLGRDDGEQTPDGPHRSPPRDFVVWLPTWYEAVLELLAEERRRSRVVFGAGAAPAIAARVLAECFRPVLQSFSSRLAAACPPPPTKMGKRGSGSLESIAAAYDATANFLSLAYDQMEAWDVDCASGSSSGATGAAGEEGTGGAPSPPSSDDDNSPALPLIRSAFLSAASPFRPYQASLAEAERAHSGEAASVVARDVRSAVGGVAGRTLASLQDAADRLGDLAPYVFPLADAAMARFELLNCGYNAPSALSGVDNLLSDHASELALAMGTLSRNATAATPSSSGGGEGGQPHVEFDEQRVHCALEILRIAGSFRRDLRAFDRSARIRLRALADDVLEARALSLGAVADNDEEGDARVPDSIVPAEIRILLAGAACGPLPSPSGGVPVDGVAELRLLSSSGGKGGDRPKNAAPPLFPKSFDASYRLASSCRSFVFDVCYAIPERRLRGMSALPVWKRERSGDGLDGGDDAESYGILPQAYITSVGEHMLALVQALEPFASDSDALATANEVMDGARDAAVQPWRDFAAAAGCDDIGGGGDALASLMSGKELTKRFLRGEGDDDDAVEHEEGDDEDEEDDPGARASAAFCNRWLDAVGSAVAGRILERSLRISRIGRKGAEHLSTDLNYIVNVFAALGVWGHPHPLLGHVASLVTMDGEELRSRVRSRRREAAVKVGAAGRGSLLLDIVRGTEARIAYARGIAV